MTREAKIGMLTGLGVIVLIGVLLSNYLGQNAAPKMAMLPVGAGYRAQMTQSPATPDAIPGNNSSATGTPIISETPPQAFAVGHDAAPAAPDMGGAAPAGPTVGAPVAPVPAGRVLADVPVAGDKLPTFQMGDGAAKPVAAVNTGGTVANATGKQYTIAQGDTLAKIAAKYYKSAKPENVQRIVAANPALLKSATTTLVIGKTLILPDVPASAGVAGNMIAKADKTAPGAKTGVMIHPPGAAAGSGTETKTSDTRTLTAGKADSAKAAAASYVVKEGDTLDKIARKISTTHFVQVAKQITALNHIKDPHDLQVGQTLKLPKA